MSFGPLPSQLCLLSDLQSKAVGEKVRFLGCVSSYSVASGILKLEHRISPDANVSALVNVELVLEKLSAEQIRVGEWVNVIGYITLISNAANVKEPTVDIQALLLWSTGPFDIQQYQISVRNLLQHQ